MLTEALDLKSLLPGGDFNGTDFVNPQNPAPCASEPSEDLLAGEAERVVFSRGDDACLGAHCFKKRR